MWHKRFWFIHNPKPKETKSSNHSVLRIFCFFNLTFFLQTGFTKRTASLLFIGDKWCSDSASNSKKKLNLLLIYDTTLTRPAEWVGHKRAQWSWFIFLVSSASLHTILEHMRRKHWAVCTGRINGSHGANCIQTRTERLSHQQPRTEKSVSRQTQKSSRLCSSAVP